MLSVVNFSGRKLIWLLLIMLIVATDSFILFLSNSLGERAFEGKGQNILLVQLLIQVSLQLLCLRVSLLAYIGQISQLHCISETCWG